MPQKKKPYFISGFIKLKFNAYFIAGTQMQKQMKVIQYVKGGHHAWRGSQA